MWVLHSHTDLDQIGTKLLILGSHGEHLVMGQQEN